MVLAVKHWCLWQTVASRMIIFRRHDNLHEVRERLYLILIFVIILLGHPVRQLTARALKLTYCPIEMYGKGALGGAKMYSGCNAHTFHAYFRLKWIGLFLYKHHGLRDLKKRRKTILYTQQNSNRDSSWHHWAYWEFYCLGLILPGA